MDYTIDLDDDVRYILVCCEAWSADRDDVVVDSITIECRWSPSPAPDLHARLKPR